ncbi:MAG TPA: UDP-3-O-(3-hydroxymyristoyl)glucosamine N-acyltransferase [Gemmatimonadaceae bacterium]|nr:UDP-3-O-(3-hydroxymyristoyl)glucosamine N-acyltransferase [Gemmatimonadaceae bacterium]
MVRSLTAGEIARLVQGELRGDASATVHAVAPLHRAGAGELSFLASARYADVAATSSASVLLVAPELADTPGAAPARIVVERPHDAVLTLLPLLYAAPPRRAGIDPTARFGRGVRLGADVTVEAYAVIGDDVVLGDRAWVGSHAVVGAAVEIGADSRLYPHVTCYTGTRVGQRVLVHAGARLGSDGFGYVYREGAHVKIPHVGRCLIDDDVEIGANTTIDRGSVDDTRVGAGTKIDNLVHLAHNVHVGRLCLIMAQVGVAGSTRIEDGAILAGQAGIAGHVTIGRGARVAAQAGVFGDVPAGESWSGYPARPHRQSLRGSAALQRLPELLKPLERLLREREGSSS